MDIDRYLDPDYDHDICLDMDSYFSSFLSLFESKFTSFIKHVYSHEITLIMGQNYQVCTSHSPVKMSCHIKIDIPCKNWSFVKQVMLNFERYLLSNIYNTPEEQAQFFYHLKGVHKSVLDRKIYTNVRSIRIPYSSKWKPNARPLIPYSSSSLSIKDHIVQVHDPKYTGFPGVTLDDLDVDIPTDVSVVDKMHVSIKHICSAVDPT